MNKETLETLLSYIIRTEHKTVGAVTKEEYQAVTKLCQEVEAPQYITEYFARKAVE